jgi:hypothetical protein
MANQAVKEIQKQAREARMKGFVKMKDGDVLILKKLADSKLGYGKYGAQAIYSVENEKGEQSQLAFGIGHPAIDVIEEFPVGAKFKIKRTGTTRDDTRYEIELAK